MIDFNKMIEEQIKYNKNIEREKALSLDLIEEQAVSDKEKAANEKMEDLYYKFFVDTTLVKIIENQIKSITYEEDRYKDLRVSINYYLYRVNREMYDLWLKKYRKFSSIRGIAVSEPDIGETIDVNGKEFSDRDMDLVCNALPKWILLHNQLSFDTWNLSEKYDSFGENYIILTFTSSLQKLIDMYYAEKQREEEKNKINIQSNKYKK